MIAIDQDALAGPATPLGGAPSDTHAPVVLKRQLADGDTVVLLVSQDPSAGRTVDTNLTALGLGGSGYQARELWTGAASTVTGPLSAALPPHGSALFRLTARTGSGPSGMVDDGKYHALTSDGLALSLPGPCGAGIASITGLEAPRTGDPAQRWTFTTQPGPPCGSPTTATPRPPGTPCCPPGPPPGTAPTCWTRRPATPGRSGS
ncbi:hypothetical protein [Kitasatospora sp. NPDC018619]|uniref:hypothetical protein n=1 Tax=unclassified Kitasatospora TaxID=2633591 RepID=UPI0037B15011